MTLSTHDQTWSDAVGRSAAGLVRRLAGLVAGGWLVVACLMAPPAALSRAAGGKPAVLACGDFLAGMGRRPPHLVYAGCGSFPEQQGKPLRATYRVPGRFAAAVAAALARSVGLGRLQRHCCVWETPVRTFTDAQGRVFSVTMASADTVVTDRAGWAAIPVFEVTVVLFTEEI